MKSFNRKGAAAAVLALPLLVLAAACDQLPASKDAPSHAQPDFVVTPPEVAPAEPAAAAPAEPARPAPEAPAVPPAPRAPSGPARPVPTGANPSFDCARASRNVERMICGDGELARADRQLAAVVARAGRFAILRDDLRSGGRAFLARRDACPDRDCILKEYSRWTGDVRGMIQEQEMIG